MNSTYKGLLELIWKHSPLSTNEKCGRGRPRSDMALDLLTGYLCRVSHSVATMARLAFPQNALILVLATMQVSARVAQPLETSVCQIASHPV